MTKNTRNLIILAVLFVVCATLVIVFEIPGLITFGDETAGKLVSDIVPRVAVTVFLGALLLLNGYAESLKFRKNGFLRALVWCLPCFLVAFANFPYSALIRGTAVIVRADLVWLFLIKCLAIALMEELFFRATLVTVLLEFTEKKKYGVFITVIGSAAVFSLTHLLNLFYGAGFGATALQVGYTFLIGCMLAVAFIKTKNVWLCVAVHAIFDVGGLIVGDLGKGPFQDTVFWVLTAACGVICTAHIIYTLIKLQRAKADEGKLS